MFHWGFREASEAPVEKGRADYYPSRPSRAKINARSILFNCKAPLINLVNLAPNYRFGRRLWRRFRRRADCRSDRRRRLIAFRRFGADRSPDRNPDVYRRLGLNVCRRLDVFRRLRLADFRRFSADRNPDRKPDSYRGPLTYRDLDAYRRLAIYRGLAAVQEIEPLQKRANFRRRLFLDESQDSGGAQLFRSEFQIRLLFSRVVFASLAGLPVFLGLRAADFIAFLSVERGESQVVGGVLAGLFRLGAIARGHYVLLDRQVCGARRVITVSQFALRFIIIGTQLNGFLQLRHGLLALLLQPVGVADAEIGFRVIWRDGRCAYKCGQRAVVILPVSQQGESQREVGFGEIIIFLDREFGVADRVARSCCALILSFGPNDACEAS